MPKKRKKKAAPTGSTRAKGDVLEQIVAEMHKAEGVVVDRNVYLPVLGEPGRTREIDVLLTSQIAGYPVRVAIECKNENKPTGVGKIDEFIGKLQDVGIPTQLGIFVSSSRYTNGAISRAEKAGVRTLLFRDRKKNLVTAVAEAFQSLIYLLLTITNIKVENDVPGGASWGEILFFRDQSGSVVGAVPDLIWQMWTQGEISRRIGVHLIDVDLPENWLQIVQGRIAKVNKIEVEVKIDGYAITFPGEVDYRTLVDASENALNRYQLKVSYSAPKGTFPLKKLSSEKELENLKSTNKGFSVIVGRFQIPRIQWMSMYWPPSESTMQKLFDKIMTSLEKGQQLDLSSLSFADIEGTDMSKAWEPIWKEHPVVKNSGKL
ncbi:MAG: restriction endonuclease [Ardenticatenaceae bacterium]|nr:restriction endonuclease [Ardenticatenaceae bacterium]MCB9443727.1 restriction endonuclease [Ardenticatenaceae bacterium]